MNIKLIVCIIAILAVAAIMIYNRRKSLPPGTTVMDALLTDEVHAGQRIIQTVGMTDDEVRCAIRDYQKLCAEEGEETEKPVITTSQDTITLRLPNGLSYNSFCYWVNYIVYSNKAKRYNENVTGWYEVPATAQGAWKPFAGQALMFFIPSTDEEFDNVYFTDHFGHCYKQEFANWANLILLEKSIRRYQPLPSLP